MYAQISRCGTYRYFLSREIDGLTPTPVAFIMLNPSTADANVDDPTIRRCLGFARDWGFGALWVVNLYGLRATNPRELRGHPDPVGPENDHWLRSVAGSCRDVVCAWGANAELERVVPVLTLLARSGVRPKCLGLTKTGAPRHPLYVRKDQPLIDYPKEPAK